MPLYMPVRKNDAFTPEEIKFLAKYPLITFEKTTGNSTFGSTEKGIIEAAKEVNKSVSSLQRALSCDKGSCANFQWKTIKLDKIEKFYPETKTRMKVFKLVPVEYKDFDSIQEMTEELNLSYGAVISAMNENRSCKGYMFEKIKI